MRITTSLALATALIAGACTAPTEPAVETTRRALGEYPEIDFSERPSYLPTNVINLTFDDGPDWNNTARVLDALAAHGAKASFYINTRNWSDVDADVPMQDLVRRMVDEGHELANHTVGHMHLPTLSPADIEAQIAGVENTVQTVIGADAPRLTLLRAPFGEPYQDGNGYDLVAPIVASHAVHVGWAIDTYDYNCPMGDSACVANNFISALEGGAYGVVLMHSVHSQTADALPTILQYIEDNGYELWTSEQVVCARFGTSSAHLVDGTTGGCEPEEDPNTSEPDAGTNDPPPSVDAGTDPPDNPGDADAGIGGDGDGDGNDGSGNASGGCNAAQSTTGAWLLVALGVALAFRRRRRRGIPGCHRL